MQSYLVKAGKAIYMATVGIVRCLEPRETFFESALRGTVTIPASFKSVAKPGAVICFIRFVVKWASVSQLGQEDGQLVGRLNATDHLSKPSFEFADLRSDIGTRGDSHADPTLSHPSRAMEDISLPRAFLVICNAQSYEKHFCTLVFGCVAGLLIPMMLGQIRTA